MTADYSIDRASRFTDWAIRTFGKDVATDPQERAMRFLEEALETAHAFGITYGGVRAVASRVYHRPAGKPARELGQALCMLEVLAKVTGIDVDREALEEFYRVQQIPQAEWDRRHAAKRALGIAM